MTEAWAARQRGQMLTWGRGSRTIRIEPYEAHDERRFEPRADFAEAFALEGGVLPDGPRWTLTSGYLGDRVLGIGGLELLGGRRLGAWALMSDLTPRQWRIAVQAAYAALFWARREFGRPTIQAVPAPTPQAVRLLKRIGFVDVGEAYMVWEG